MFIERIGLYLMEQRTIDYCHAEDILTAKPGLKEEIAEILHTVKCSWGLPEDPAHRLIRDAFMKHGWKSEVLVSKRTNRPHYFDLYKNRVAMELEFSRREMFYRDYFRFLLAEREGMIDVGVIITRDRDLTAHVVGPLGNRADIHQVTDDLSWVLTWVRTPIWVIAVK
jgi:hypothetical protein